MAKINQKYLAKYEESRKCMDCLVGTLKELSSQISPDNWENFRFREVTLGKNKVVKLVPSFIIKNASSSKKTSRKKQI